ncbi:DNA endonuclease RBBP8 [Salmo salar]|uniref:DNA endonuclease RBBP8 n=1 Tax=Salmo salar TaxID=8030 RepID=A0A1S3NDY3_SALSA|nr:DNA endonuclease RBBP8 [Salmo salar]
MRKKQEEFEKGRQQNMLLVAALMTERNTLQDKNRKLSQELDKLKGSLSASPEPEGVIPDSPLQQISRPVVSKMRRRKETNHVRYAEKPLSQSQSSALNGLLHTKKCINVHRYYTQGSPSVSNTGVCTLSHTHTYS